MTTSEKMTGRGPESLKLKKKREGELLMYATNKLKRFKKKWRIKC